MKRLLIVFLSICCLAFAKADYEQMSNEELIALIGYVSDDKKSDFADELEKRKSSFSQEERRLYEENIKKEVN